jgi:hypothetical protein
MPIREAGVVPRIFAIASFAYYGPALRVDNPDPLEHHFYDAQSTGREYGER